MIDQKNGPVEFTPAAMPRDNDGNIAYEAGNFFETPESHGLRRPRHAHQPTSWDKFKVDLVLSQPSPNWQHAATRFGLISRVMAGPYYKLGYHGHCHACDGYFLTLEWAQNHECSKEQAFRDATDRRERDYPALRKAAKQLAAEQAKNAAEHRGILAALKRLVPFARG